ncbi:SH3 domain-containing protein [Candidatus Electronema sp. PJ]|uniref:SH3 domain-containing protein n=1 Tax=Candidatus Electronema sp. PJ TaxID=3401572 RepID=UPI003AA8403D
MNHWTFAARLGILLVTLAFAAAASAAEFVSVVKDGVNLRSTPDAAASNVLFQLPAGYPLQVIERKGDWLNVSDYENDKGWIAASLVSKVPYVIVKAAKGNIRAEASTDSPQVGRVVREVILKKIDQQGDWIKVSHSQLPSGWIHRQLVWP